MKQLSSQAHSNILSSVHKRSLTETIGKGSFGWDFTSISLTSNSATVKHTVHLHHMINQESQDCRAGTGLRVNSQLDWSFSVYSSHFGNELITNLSEFFDLLILLL